MKNICYALCIAFLMGVDQAFSSEAGMPQLNPEFWASQIFWLIVTFSSLYFIIWKFFLPRITYSIENRKSRIVTDLNEAQKLKENAEKKLNAYNEIIEQAKKDAKKIIEDNKKKLDRDIEQKKKKFNNEIEKEIAEAEKEIKNLKNSSMLNIKNIASETTSEVVKQIINTEINKSSISAIVDDVAKKEMSKFI